MGDITVENCFEARQHGAGSTGALSRSLGPPTLTLPEFLAASLR